MKMGEVREAAGALDPSPRRPTNFFFVLLQLCLCLQLLLDASACKTKKLQNIGCIKSCH